METVGITAVTIGQVLYWTALITIAALCAFAIFRAMSRPRLVLIPTPSGPRARPRDVVQYAVSMPFLIMLWYGFFFVVLLVSNNELNALQLAVLPLAVVLSVRILAHVAQHASEELAKVVPIALIAIVILDGNIRPPEDFTDLLDSVTQLDEGAWPTAFVVLADYALTAAWYWGYVRWWQPRRLALAPPQPSAPTSGQQVVDHDGGVAVLPDADGAHGGT